MGKTRIRTADYTMNWWVGCTRVSEGCERCYAADWVTKLGQRDFWTPSRTQTWRHPYAWQRRLERTGGTAMVFCNSFSDFFHPASACGEWRAEAWRTMGATPNLVYRITTKRPENVGRMLPPDWGEGYPNVWLGVTVESRRHLGRLGILRSIPAAARYAAMEPLLEDVTPGLDLGGVSWVVCGGENGRGCRPMDIEWARNLRDRCEAQRVPFWYLGGGGGHQKNNLLDGALHEELPPWPGITERACAFYCVLGHLASDDPAYLPLEDYGEAVLLLPGAKAPGQRLPAGRSSPMPRAAPGGSTIPPSPTEAGRRDRVGRDRSRTSRRRSPACWKAGRRAAPRSWISAASGG